jgi:hypothetical protein
MSSQEKERRKGEGGWLKLRNGRMRGAAKIDAWGCKD